MEFQRSEHVTPSIIRRLGLEKDLEVRSYDPLADHGDTLQIMTSHGSSAVAKCQQGALVLKTSVQCHIFSFLYVFKYEN